MKSLHLPFGSLCAVALLASIANAQGLLSTVTGPDGGTIGKALVAVGDVDGDNADDFAVSSAADLDSVDVISSVGLGILHHFTTPLPNIGFGGAICGGGDLDLDRTPDIIIGAPFAGVSSTGEAFVYSGATGVLIRSHLGVGTNGLFGWHVAMLGDINADGASEYAITAAKQVFGLPGLAYVNVYSGIDGRLLKTFQATEATGFGTSIIGLNDVTGDGVPDLAIGEPGASSGGFTSNGAVRIYSGATFQLVTSVLGAGELALLGMSMAALEDLDGDGSHEFAVNVFENNAFVNGVLVCSAASGLVLVEAFGDIQVALPSGIQVARVADADGDERDDVLFLDRDRSSGNIVMVGSVSGKRLFITQPIVPGSGFPHQVAGTGDVNLDGYPEFLASDPFVSDPGQATGTVWMLTTKPLLAKPATLSAFAPNVVDFTMSPGVDHAGATYAMLASVTPEGGSCSGMDVGTASIHIPFCFDAVTRASLDLANTAVFQTTIGLLDAYTGQGAAKLDVSGIGLPPSVVGLVLYFFFLTKPPGSGWDQVWDAASVEIVP